MKDTRTPILTAACVLCALALPTPGAGAPEPAAPAFVHETTDSYTTRTMHGFTVRVSHAALAHRETTDPALALLDEKLAQVIELTPEQSHKSLRTVVFWIEHDNPGFPCACYHPGADWLSEHGYNTDKEKGIEISNPAHFVKWCRRDQPLMVLHELAHAYHDLTLGYDDPRVIACYEHAKAGGAYGSVEHVSGQMRPHYAMNNPQEYFAELSESYFGRNDFAPFDRASLRVFDPEGYAMIETLWDRAGGEKEEKSGDLTAEHTEGKTEKRQGED